MEMMDYAGKHFLVMGLGESGLAMVRWLHRCGAVLRVADTRIEPQGLMSLRALGVEVEFVGGAENDRFDAALLEGMDAVAVSPGLMPGRELADILPAAAQKQIPVLSEIEIFAQALAALRAERAYAPKVIAVTGTNGKTTVASMTALLCRHAGLTTEVCGNISPAALDCLRRVLDENRLPQVWVLELSSFQLHATRSLQADAATVLNVTQDHLDWHGDIASYAADKARIFGKDTTRVLNRDDVQVMQMGSGQDTITFGADEAIEPGSFGLAEENGMCWLIVAASDDELQGKKQEKQQDNKKKTRTREVNVKALADVAVTGKKLMPVDALRIKGRHNALNALAALAMCRAIGLPFAPLLHGLRTYCAQPHRMEWVASIGDVNYYDDSKGTNVGAAVAALVGLGQERANACPHVILIAGGDGKGQNFSPLALAVARYAKAVLLIGKDAPLLQAALKETGVRTIYCDTLQNATMQAATWAVAGDVVLLSPACSSLDMFGNYVERARVFCDAVREIALSCTEVSA